MREKSVAPVGFSIGLAFFSFVLVGLNGGANGVLIPSLSGFYHVGSAVIGQLFLVSSLGYFLSALSSGPLTEKLGLRWFLLLGILSLSLGLLGFGLMLPFALLMVSRLLMGLGIGIIETGFNVFVTALPRHTTQLNYLHAFYGVGGLVGPLFAATILALAFGWNIVYLLFTGLNLLLLLGIVLFFRPGPSAESDAAATTHDQLPERNVLSATLRLPIVWIAALFLLLYGGVEVSLGNWGYSFLLGARGQGAVQASWIVSGFWTGLTLGRFTLQRLAERFGVGIEALMYACLAGLGIGLLLIWVFPFSVVAAIGFCFIGLSLAPIYPLTVAVIPELVPARLSSSTIGLLVSISIIGLAIFPWLAGVLAQVAGIWTLLPYTLGLTLLLVVCWGYLARRISSKPEAQ